MFRTQAFLSLLLTCAIATVNASAGLAQAPASPPGQTSPPNPTDNGLISTNEVLDQVCDFLKAQQSFTVTMDVTYDNVLDSGSKVQYSAYQNLWVQKPDRLRSDYVGDQRVTNFFYDGKSFTLQAPQQNYYATKPAPATLDAVLDQVDQNYGITIPMSNLLASDPCADMKADVQRTIFIGNDMVNREEMYHILVIGKQRDYQMWVTQDEPPLMRKAIITYKDLPEAPQYTVLLSNWNFKPRISEETFTFTPPKGAQKIELLTTESLPVTGASDSLQNAVVVPTEPRPTTGGNPVSAGTMPSTDNSPVPQKW
jgi:hypothetical protein